MSDETDSKEPTGPQKGGIARAAALTDERKREIAQNAALARWGARATHRGNFKEEFGIDVDCYVLDDAAKTAVISQTGMGKAIGLSSRGNALPRFLASDAMSEAVGAELGEKLAKPLKFQWGSGGAQVFGYDATILVDLCKAIIRADAEGRLKPQQKKLATQAASIIAGAAKSGIKNLVYALAGYDATRQEIIEAFRFYVREEAREYEKEFPDQLYEEWYRLYQLPKPEKNKPWKFQHLTVKQVYHPLARSQGKVYLLTQEKRSTAGERWKKLHQFLSEVGVKALRTHLGQLLGIARISGTKEEYERYVNQLFGDQPDLFHGR